MLTPNTRVLVDYYEWMDGLIIANAERSNELVKSQTWMRCTVAVLSGSHLYGGIGLDWTPRFHPFRTKKDGSFLRWDASRRRCRDSSLVDLSEKADPSALEQLYRQECTPVEVMFEPCLLRGVDGPRWSVIFLRMVSAWPWERYYGGSDHVGS
jgi:hypothetical protein